MKTIKYIAYVMFIGVLFAISDVVFVRFFERLPALRTEVYVQNSESALHRVSHIEQLFYELKPNTENRHFKINSWGMRDSELRQKKDRYRIVVLGDSVTFGNHKLAQEQLFTEVAENELNQGEKKYEILNAGVNGYNTRQEYIALKEKYLAIHPDMAVFAFCINDFSDSLVQYIADDYVHKKITATKEIDPKDCAYKNLSDIEYLELVLPPLSVFPYKYDRWLLANSGIYRTISLCYLKNKYKIEDLGTLPAFLFSCRFESTLAKIKKLASENKIVVQFLILPTKKEHIHNAQAISCLSKKGLSFWDCNRFVENKTLDRESLWDSDGYHLSREGHRVVGQLLAKKIQELKR